MGLPVPALGRGGTWNTSKRVVPPCRHRFQFVSQGFALGPRSGGEIQKTQKVVVPPPFSSFPSVDPGHSGRGRHFENFENGWALALFNVFKVSPSAAALGIGDRRHGIARATTLRKEPVRRHPPRPPNETLRTGKWGGHHQGQRFQSLVSCPLGGGGDPTPTAKCRTPPGRDGVLYGSTAGTPMGRSQ